MAAGIFQLALASPTLKIVPAYKAASLRPRQADNSTNADLLTDLATILTEVDPKVGVVVDGLISNVLGGLVDDHDEAAQIYSAILTYAVWQCSQFSMGANNSMNSEIEDTVAAQVIATPTDIPAATSGRK